MKAQDIMVSPVVTVTPETSVQELAQLLIDRRISGVPVLDAQGTLVGIVSEGDLLRRTEAATERRSSWWLELLSGPEQLASEYVRAHSRRVGDIMRREVVTARPDTPVDEIATLMERYAIKRVPIVEDGRVVGIISRANLIQAVASRGAQMQVPASDGEIRDQVLARLRAQPWAHLAMVNVTVSGGTVNMWGMVPSEAEREAMRVVAEEVAGVGAVRDNLTVWSPAYVT
jgi:CBS domain-containing protein